MNLPLNKTKIVATIGPACSDPQMLEQMIRAGMDVARLNFSHGDFNEHLRNIVNLRSASKSVRRRVAIMADLSGPKIRIGSFNVEKIILRSGDAFTLTTDDLVGDQERCSVSFPHLPQVVKRGDVLSLNDGYIQLRVAGVQGANISCVVMVGGELRSRKGLNLPGIDLGISAFTERDRECLKFALENGVGAVSQSFVESATDLQRVRDAARQMGKEIFLIAKIERARALDRLDEIINAADGIMIARGDLGVEVPIERIALVQKDLMRRANRQAKPVITATQMLESMTMYRLPTRAEATDVSNAILDGTDCVMLSGESAIGAYPVESVAMLARIAAAVEPKRHQLALNEVSEGAEAASKVRPEQLIAISVEASIQSLKPAAVFASTVSGVSVRRLSAYRLPVWIAAVSQSEKACQDLLFSYGVFPQFEAEPPASWNTYVKEWLRRHELSGEFAILARLPSPTELESNHRMEVIHL